ncbi:hypothetical protein GMSM_42970 [Geomonas sp. Red276]
MVRRVLVAVALSVAVSGGAWAENPASAVSVAEAGGESSPGPTSVPGPPPTETPEAKAEVLYRFGVNGFVRGEGAGNMALGAFSYLPEHSEGRFVYRAKPYAFWHPTDYLDLHLEGQLYGFTGRRDDDWQLALYQGYLEARIPGSNLLSLKGGRQEFAYGSNFMLGADAFFNGLSYDGGRLRIQPTDTVSLDLLGGGYVAPWADGVKGNLAGAYGTWTLGEGKSLEGYFLRDYQEVAGLPGQTINSYGLRGTTKVGPLCVEIEPVYQNGEIYRPSTGSNTDVSAFGGHLDLTAELEGGGMHHKLWGGYAAGTGSKGAAEGGSARYEFHNPSNDSSIVGDMSLFADLSGANVAGHHASGLQVYTLGYGIDLTKELNVAATGHYFTAAAVEDGFSTNLGLETDFALTYTFSDNYSVILAYDHFFSGPFFRQAGGGEDVHFAYAMLQFNLEKSKLKGK